MDLLLALGLCLLATRTSGELVLDALDTGFVILGMEDYVEEYEDRKLVEQFGFGDLKY